MIIPTTETRQYYRRADVSEFQDKKFVTTTTAEPVRGRGQSCIQNRSDSIFCCIHFRTTGYRITDSKTTFILLDFSDNLASSRQSLRPINGSTPSIRSTTRNTRTLCYTSVGNAAPRISTTRENNNILWFYF